MCQDSERLHNALICRYWSPLENRLWRHHRCHLPLSVLLSCQVQGVCVVLLQMIYQITYIWRCCDLYRQLPIVCNRQSVRSILVCRSTYIYISCLLCGDGLGFRCWCNVSPSSDGVRFILFVTFPNKQIYDGHGVVHAERVEQIRRTRQLMLTRMWLRILQFRSMLRRGFWQKFTSSLHPEDKP